MAIKVNIATLINTNQPLIQLANQPLPPKAKYWLGRIAEAMNSHLADYDQKRFAIIREMGRPIRMEPQPDIEIDGVMTPQKPLEIEITDQEEANKPQTMWKVKDELADEFNKRLDELQAHEVVIRFNKVSLDALGDAPVAVHLAALDWVIDAE